MHYFTINQKRLFMGGRVVFTGRLIAYITLAILSDFKVLILEILFYQKINVANDFVSAKIIAIILIIMNFNANIGLKYIAVEKK